MSTETIPRAFVLLPTFVSGVLPCTQLTMSFELFPNAFGIATHLCGNQFKCDFRILEILFQIFAFFDIEVRVMITCCNVVFCLTSFHV